MLIITSLYSGGKAGKTLLDNGSKEEVRGAQKEEGSLV